MLAYSKRQFTGVYRRVLPHLVAPPVARRAWASTSSAWAALGLAVWSRQGTRGPGLSLRRAIAPPSAARGELPSLRLRLR